MRQDDDQSDQAPAVELRRLSKTFDRSTAVDSVDLDVAEAEFVTLLGPSGSGKSTTLMMLAGFEAPTTGDILVRGRSMLGMPPSERGIGVVFQSYALFPHMTVYNNIAFPLRMRGLDPTTLRPRVGQAMDMVRLTGLETRYPSQLSGGQQQRVALARALVFGPSLLLMDEPLGALDKHLRVKMQFEIKQIQKALGIAVLYVTHDQEEAMSMSDRIAVMDAGRIIQVAPPQSLYDRPASAFVARFIGDSNFIPIRPGGARQRAVGPGGVDIVLPSDTSSVPGTTAVLVVRPERARLATEQPPSGTNGVACVISSAQRLGGFIVYEATLRDKSQVTVRQVVKSSTTFLARHGDEVIFCWDPDDAHVLTGSLAVRSESLSPRKAPDSVQGVES